MRCVGVEYANWLLSITKTTGSRRTPAKFMDSCAVPWADEPSPSQPSATRGSPRTRNASAAPTATGRIEGRCDGPAKMPMPGRHVLRAQVRVAAVRRPADAAHVLAEHAPGLDAAVEVQAEVAMQRRRHVLGRHGRRDADGGRLVPLAGVERARQLALLVEHVPALVEPPREHQRVQDAHQRVAIEPERSSILQPAAGLRSPNARNRHAASVAIHADRAPGWPGVRLATPGVRLARTGVRLRTGSGPHVRARPVRRCARWGCTE